MPDVRSAREVLRDELVAHFSTIHVNTQLENVNFRSTVFKVNATKSTNDTLKPGQFPQLDVLFGEEKFFSTDVNKTVWESTIPVMLFGYTQLLSPTLEDYPATRAMEEFLHDVKRVLTDLSMSHIIANNRWILLNNENSPVTIKTRVERNDQNNYEGDFLIQFNVRIQWKDRTLRPEVP